MTTAMASDARPGIRLVAAPDRLPTPKKVAPIRAAVAPARCRSTVMAAADVFGWLKPNAEMTTNKGASRPNSPPHCVQAHSASTPAAIRATSSAACSRVSAGMRRARRALTWLPPIRPTALAPNTQPKWAAGMWSSPMTTRGADVM